MWEYSPTTGFSSLGAGETATDTVTVATEDGTEQQISITINGDNDDAVITGDVSGVMGQDDEGTSGDLNHTDVDNNNPDDAWNTTVVSQGSFGTLSISGDGVWEYSPTTGFSSLGAGETVTDTVTVATQDGTEQQISITINGDNDDAVITGDVSGGVTEDSGVPATGDLNHTDVDNNNPDDAWNTTDVSQGSFGTLTITPTGGWSYALDNGNATVDALDNDGAIADTLIDTITVTAADGTQQQIEITIEGVNDDAVITGDNAGSVTENAGVDATGDLDHTDVDAGDDDDLWDTNVVAQGQYGTLAIGADGQWSYALDDANVTVDALAAGDTLTDTITVATGDGTQDDITITINGANDPSIAGGQVSGTITEDGAPLGLTRNADHTDVDGDDDAWQVGSNLPGTYGELSNTTAGQWTYVLDEANATVDALNVGDTLTDTVNITAADGTEVPITVTINGANDAAIITGDVSGTGSEDSGTNVTGDLNHTDVDNPDDEWNTTVVTQGTFGTLTVSAAGAWTYAVDNANAAVDALSDVAETLIDTITVSTADGTQQQISVTIEGSNDDSIISGDFSGNVIEDDGTSATGDLDHTDVDTADADDDWSTSVNQDGQYGSLTIASDGNWTYVLDDGNVDVNALGDGETLTDSVLVETSGGTIAEITITIDGANELIEGDANDNILTGTSVGDTILGFAGDDQLFGLDGNDILDGGTGSLTWFTPGGEFIDGQFLDGGAGDDVLTVEGGFSILRGGAGNDTLTAVNNGTSTTWDWVFADYTGSTNGIVANFTGGTLGGLASGEVADGFGTVDTVSGVHVIRDSDNDDQITIDGSWTNSYGNWIEVRLTDGDDTVDFTGVTGTARISWQNAADGVNASLVTGMAFDNDLSNGDQIGTDTFINANYLRGSDFNDSLTGHTEDDAFRGAGGDDFIDGGAGFDRVDHSSSNNGIVVDLSLSSEQVQSDGLGGKDTLVSIEDVGGSYLSDWIAGDDGDNALFGSYGDDLLIGRGGNDFLGDQDFSDGQLIGGDDILIGGTGNDTLRGGIGADKFVFQFVPGGDDEFDTIQDFNLGQGDVIDISDYGFSSTANFGSFTFDGTNTIIELDVPNQPNQTNQIVVENVDLTALTDPNVAFLFDGPAYIVGTAGTETLNGTSGDDIYIPGDNDPDFGDRINPSGGDDVIDFFGLVDGFYDLRYDNLEANITVNITGATGTIDKDGGGVDTLLNLDEFYIGSPGGLRIRTGFGNDDFNVDTTEVEWLALRVGGDGGADTVTHTGTGFLRLEFSNYDGVDVNATTGTVTELNGGSSTLSATGFINEWRGSAQADIFLGSINDDRFITQEGDDNVNGNDGVDTLRYDRFFFDGFGGVTGVNVEYTAQGAGTASGIWYGQSFTDTFQNIEIVRGSNVGVDSFTGSSGAETFDGRGGANLFNGGGGSDTLIAGGEANVFIFGLGSGTDTIKNFVVGRDQIVLEQDFAAVDVGDLDGISLVGSDTVIDINGADIITVEGVDLIDIINNDPSDIFTFNTIDGTAGDDRGASALNGTAGNDVILGNDGNDELFGGDGNDVLNAGGTGLSFFSDGNLLEGGTGNDTLIAEEGFNILRGGAGNDVIAFTQTDFTNFDNFWDWAWADYSTSTSGIVVNFSTNEINGLTFGQVADGLGGIDTVQGVHVVVDSAFDDVFYVDEAWQNQYQSSWLEVRLSDGDDHVEFDPDINDIGGTARISYQLAEDGVFASLVTGTASDNNADNGDQIGSDTFTNANYLRGSNHADHLEGDSDDNRFRGSGGDDLIDGGLGDDQVDHNDSIGSVIADLSQNTVFDDGKGGRDTLVSIENINGGYGDDIISGDAQDNEIRGNTGDDVLIGGDGDDFLRGGSGDIFQDGGNLLDGDDILIGGDGSDTLRGGDGADTFVMLAGPGFDVIEDFNLSDGDKIDLRAVAASVGDFTFFQYDAGGNFTDINVGPNVLFRVEGVDLTSLPNPADAFVFDGSTQKFIETEGDDNINGTSGNDFIAPGNSGFDGDNINGSAGDDTIEFLGTVNGFYTLNYGFGVGSIAVNLTDTPFDHDSNGATPDIAANSILKGAGGTDTLLNVDMINGLEGGLQIRGSNADDIFNVDTTGVEWLAIRGGADFGDDTITRTGTGILRVDLRDYEGVTVDAAAGSATERFAVNGDPADQATLTVTGFVDEWRGSFFDDIFIGTSGDDRFITESGNDNVDGGDGTDTVRYNRSGVGNLAVVYSSPGAAIVAGTWGLAAFIDDLTSVERILGSDLGVDRFEGSSGDEIFIGNDGANYFDAAGGNDLLKGGSGADLFIIGPGNGNDVIRNFMVGEDLIDLSGYGLPARPASSDTALMVRIRSLILAAATR